MCHSMHPPWKTKGKIMSKLDIVLIPKIMRKNNWINGAKLMEKWFNDPSNSQPTLGIPSTDIIKMDWILSYPRAKTVYDTLVREKVWENAAAQREIVGMLKRRNLLSTTSQQFGFNKFNIPLIDKDAIQFRVVGGYWDMAFGDMDDLRAALARFIFKVIIKGEVSPVPNTSSNSIISYKVTISEIGIYARDSYDFNDAPGEDQELGNWDKDDNSVGRTIFNGGDEIKNSDFRNWRKSHTKGGDFIVYSDIKTIKLNTPSTFEFNK